MNDYNEEFMFEDQVLHVRLSGNFPSNLLQKDKNAFQPLINACTTRKYKKAVIDARELNVSFDTYQMISLFL